MARKQNTAPKPRAATLPAPPVPDGTSTPAAKTKAKAGKGFSLDRMLKVTKPLVKGKDVKAIQEALISRGFFCGVDGATGIYGGQTAAAVRKFQAMNRLVVTGRVEKFTAAALGGTWQE